MAMFTIEYLLPFVDRTGAGEERIRTYIAELERWNRRIRLMARGEDPVPHVVDSLVLARHLPSGTRLVDVGTGAGLPGLVVAMVRDDVRVTLVEPVSKKTAFLAYVAGLLGVDVEIVTARIEDLAPRRWENAVCKALTDPVSWTAMASSIAHTLWYYPTTNNIGSMPQGWEIVEQWEDPHGRPRYLARWLRS